MESHFRSNTNTYDAANRLIEVDGVPHTWSDGGNLLDDGANAYTYDHANRLTMVCESDNENTYAFAYNGLGDRLEQVLNGQPTRYTLDPSASLRAGLATGLTQVLSDGTNGYLYGVGRIGEEQPGGWQYHLGDALGSVRQLADASVNIVLTRSYEPFGDPLSTTGSGTSIYGFAGEQRDGTGLVYLRSRYYGSYLNQWIQPDPIVPAPFVPADWNGYVYVRNNPVNYTDPSGLYGNDVHYDLTYSLADEAGRLAGIPTFVARLIAQGDWRVDNSTTYPLNVGMIFHFVDQQEAWGMLGQL
jgi:RHS repeat-associated protein